MGTLIVLLLILVLCQWFVLAQMVASLRRNRELTRSIVARYETLMARHYGEERK